jgi:hypothetical protein
VSGLSSISLPGGVIEKSLFICDRDGNRIEDISDVYTSGSVKYREDLGGGIPTVFTMELIGAERVTPLKDIVTPYLKIIRDDGSFIGPRRFGAFVVGQPDTTITQTVSRKSYPCEDLTAILRDAVFNDVYKVPSGTNIGSAIRGIIENGGLTQIRLPATAKTTGYTRNFPKGMSCLEAANSLCQAAKWYPLWMTSQAVITTQESKLLSQTQAIRQYTNADYIGTIQDKPTRGQIGNVVAVRRERSDKPTLYAIRRNTDVEDPSSIPSLEREILYTGGWIDATDAEDQDDVDAYADRLYDEMRSYERTVTMTVLPDFDVLGEHRVIDLDINTDGSNFEGRYWLRQWQIGMSPKEAAMQLTLNRFARFGQGEDV